jgi:hypothetical protein
MAAVDSHPSTCRVFKRALKRGGMRLQTELQGEEDRLEATYDQINDIILAAGTPRAATINV